MPLSTLTGVIAPVPSPPPRPPRDHTPAYQPGTMRATWTDPGGTEWELTGPYEQHGRLTTEQISGWGATPVSHVLDPLDRGGAQVRHVRAEPRTILWPLNIYGDTHLEFTRRWRQLMRAFTATSQRGPGVLTVWRPDGTARAIDAYYEDGFGGEAGEGWLYANPVLALLCPDGYWRDRSPLVVRREWGPPAASYLDPFPTVSSGNVLGDTVITNAGDVQAWPSWTITGPAQAITAVNHSADAAFTLTYALSAGQAITITTAGARPSVRGPDGQSLIGALDWPAAELWPLLPGDNSVAFNLEGAGAGAAVELVYHRRYESW